MTATRVRAHFAENCERRIFAQRFDDVYEKRSRNALAKNRRRVRPRRADAREHAESRARLDQARYGGQHGRTQAYCPIMRADAMRAGTIPRTPRQRDRAARQRHPARA